MPNHFHGIIMIGENKYNQDRPRGNTRFRRDAMHRVSTTDPQPQNQFGTQRKNLASIIRGFKSAVTKNARMIEPNFGWQSRFHDHIIRNEDSFYKISEYIVNNPSNWDEDKFYPE